MGRIYVNDNRIVIDEMIKIYEPDDYDWMAYQITKSNILTFHHIMPECEGGLAVIENGALITKKAHRLLNMLPSRDKGLYEAWNFLFTEINRSKAKPTEEHFREMKSLKKISQRLIY